MTGPKRQSPESTPKSSPPDDSGDTGPLRYSGGLRPERLRLRVIPTGPSEERPGLFDGLLVFAFGPETGSGERWELAVQARAIRGSKITPLGPLAIDTKVLVPDWSDHRAEDLTVATAYPEIEVEEARGKTPRAVASRYKGLADRGAGFDLPVPETFTWVALQHDSVQVLDAAHERSTLLAECSWRPRNQNPHYDP